MLEGRTRPWVTAVLIAANVVMFALEIASGASPIAPAAATIIELGGSYPPLTLGGEWWRLGSSMFLHFGIIHIAMNMVCLYQARVVEQLFGRLGYLTIYALAGLGGGVATLVVGAHNAVSAGASGAVFGVYGAFAAFLVLRRAEIQEEAWRRTARSLGRFLVLNLLIGLGVASISLSAHVGGVVVGFGVGAALLAGGRAAQPRRLRALALLVLGLAAITATVVALPGPPDALPWLHEFDTVGASAIRRWNELIDASKQHAIGERELLDALEREVLPRYKKMREDVLAARDVPAHLQPLYERLTGLMAARIAAWDAYDAALREPDPEARKPLLAAYHDREAALRDQLAAYNAETRRLDD
jgi:rhomboid protease GluP